MLLGNYTVHNRNPLRFLGGSTASPEVNHQSNFVRGGRRKNRQYVGMTTAANKQFSLPYGSYPPYMTLLPQKGGDIAARRSADFSISPTASGGLGLPGVGTAAIGIDTNAPEGQLVSTVQPGGAPASIGITTNTPALTASISGVGAAAIGLDLNTPILGAIASLIANADIGIATNAPTIYPLSDAPVLREATATIGLDGTLTRYAVGHMTGTTVDQGLTLDNIVSGVWNAALIDYDTAGSSGLALSTASSGGVDPSILAAAVWAYVSRTLTSGGSITAQNVWEYVDRTLTGSGVTAGDKADIVSGVFSQAVATPIWANIQQVNTQSIDGTGTEADPWGPV